MRHLLKSYDFEMYIEAEWSIESCIFNKSHNFNW